MGVAAILVAGAIVIGPPQNGSTVRVPAAGTLVVRLPGNQTTGFRWSPSHVPAGVRLTSTRYVPTRPVRPGSGGTFVFRFTVRCGGRLQLVYRRPWEKATPPARRFTVVVSVSH